MNKAVNILIGFIVVAIVTTGLCTAIIWRNNNLQEQEAIEDQLRNEITEDMQVEETEEIEETITEEIITDEVVVTPEEERLNTVESYLNTMTTEEKIGQLFMMDFRTDDEGNDITTLSDEVASQISEYHLGGVILFAENIDTAEQTTQLIEDMQAVANITLFMGVDEEGGIVSRLDNSNIEHEEIPSAAEITSNEEAASTGTIIGEELKALGFNVDFAPVADVNTNPDNPVIGSRAYSEDASIVSERVSAFITALQDTGIAGAAKHFPGHGDTTTDTHYGTASVTHDLERLETVEFLPFESAIEAGVDMILVGHIQVPNVTGDDIPASLNPQIIDLLRDNLGYDGVVITDGMDMEAITESYGIGESAVMAIEADVDIVLMPADLTEAYTAVEEAVASGRITEENLNDSVTRVLLLKYDLGLIE